MLQFHLSMCLLLRVLFVSGSHESVEQHLQTNCKLKICSDREKCCRARAEWWQRLGSLWKWHQSGSGESQSQVQCSAEIFVWKSCKKLQRNSHRFTVKWRLPSFTLGCCVNISYTTSQDFVQWFINFYGKPLLKAARFDIFTYVRSSFSILQGEVFTNSKL